MSTPIFRNPLSTFTSVSIPVIEQQHIFSIQSHTQDQRSFYILSQYAIISWSKSKTHYIVMITPSDFYFLSGKPLILYHFSHLKPLFHGMVTSVSLCKTCSIRTTMCLNWTFCDNSEDFFPTIFSHNRLIEKTHYGPTNGWSDGWTDEWTDEWTDGRTDERTDGPSYRDAWLQLTTTS